MARKCSVCGHPERERIDSALVAGQAIAGIARDFAVSEDALARHKTSHIPAALAKAQAAQEVAHADSLLDRLMRLVSETLAILKEARTGDDKDNGLALAAIARAEKQIELQARLIGELREGAIVNVALVTQSPEWAGLRTKILLALDGYPDARQAVIDAIA